MTTVDERIEKAKANAAALARRRGLDEAHVAEEVRQAEKIHSDPGLQAIYSRMDREEAERQQAEELAATQRQNRQEREFAEALDKHCRDRMEFYRAKGVPEATFRAELWPELRRAFAAGEEDQVDRARRERSVDVF